MYPLTLRCTIHGVCFVLLNCDLFRARGLVAPLHTYASSAEEENIIFRENAYLCLGSSRLLQVMGAEPLVLTLRSV